MPFATWDARTSSWRTLQPSLWDATSTPFLGHWPKSVSIRSGDAFERPTLVRLMAAIGGGASRGTPDAWPTPYGFGGKDHTGKLGAGGEFEKFVNNWPTPRVAAERSSRKSMVENQQWSAPSLEQVAELSLGILPREFASPAELKGASRDPWPTPVVPNGGRTSNTPESGHQTDLGAMASQWATPAARDWRQGDASAATLSKNSRPLNEQATHWSTPLGSEPRQGYKGGSTFQQSLSTEAVDFLSGPQAQPIAGHGKPFSLGGRTLRPQLSALFVEWLMGLPLGWSCVCATGEIVSGDSVTQLSRSARRRRSGSSGIAPSESGRD